MNALSKLINDGYEIKAASVVGASSGPIHYLYLQKGNDVYVVRVKGNNIGAKKLG